MNIQSAIQDFNSIKEANSTLPQRFFFILQAMLKNTNAEIIILRGNYSDREYLIDECCVSYVNKETLVKTNDVSSFCINNKNWRLDHFRDKNESLVSENDPIWNIILKEVECDKEYEQLKEIYNFYYENFQEESIAHFIEYETYGEVHIYKDKIVIK